MLRPNRRASPGVHVIIQPARQPNPIRPTPESVTIGRQHFQTFCSPCHGPEGKGISASKTPNFADPDWQAGRSDQALLDALTKGTDKGMPGFEGQLSSGEIDQMIHCMVRGFARAPQGR